MDNDDLIEAGESSPLPGLAPVVEQAIRQALKDQAGGAAAAVVADRLAEQDLDELAHRALERELLDLAEPARPYFATLPEWIEQWLLPSTADRCAVTSECGARSGGATPKLSPASTRCGAPGNTCA